MILTAVIFIIVGIVTWRLMQSSFNPVAHFLNSGSNNDETMQESELTKLLDTADSLYQSRNWLPAEKAYLRVLKFDHSHLFAYRRLALIYTYLHNYADAAECLELVMKSDPTAADLQNYSTILHHAKRLPEAIQAMQRSFTLEPTLARATSLARLYGQAGDTAKQYESLRAAVEIAPDDPTVIDMITHLQKRKASGEIEK